MVHQQLHTVWGGMGRDSTAVFHPAWKPRGLRVRPRLLQCEGGWKVGELENGSCNRRRKEKKRIRAEPLIPLVNGEGARMEVWWPSDWWERGGASERVATKDLQNLSSKVSGFEKEFLVKVNVFLAHL